MMQLLETDELCPGHWFPMSGDCADCLLMLWGHVFVLLVLLVLPLEF